MYPDDYLTQSERRTYQSLRSQGASHEDAISDALDGVDIHDVRRARGLRGQATRALHRTSDEGLLRAYAALTHRLHAADRKKGPEAAVLAVDLRQQRDRVEEEILKRMRKE